MEQRNSKTISLIPTGLGTFTFTFRNMVKIKTITINKQDIHQAIIFFNNIPFYAGVSSQAFCGVQAVIGTTYSFYKINQNVTSISYNSSGAGATTFTIEFEEVL